MNKLLLAPRLLKVIGFTVNIQCIIINKSTMILLDRYELLKAYGEHSISVGFGSYGQVKLALDKKTNKRVAVKIVLL